EASTRSRVSGRTLIAGSELSTRETTDTDTPAWPATSRSVTMPGSYWRTPPFTQTFPQFRCDQIGGHQVIDRESVVRRHTVRYREPQPEAPLSVGNGELAFTVDHTGLQTFADRYEREAARARKEHATPLCTPAQWGYPWEPNTRGLPLAATYEPYTRTR